MQHLASNDIIQDKDHSFRRVQGWRNVNKLSFVSLLIWGELTGPKLQSSPSLPNKKLPHFIKAASFTWQSSMFMEGLLEIQVSPGVGEIPTSDAHCDDGQRQQHVVDIDS